MVTLANTSHHIPVHLGHLWCERPSSPLKDYNKSLTLFGFCIVVVWCREGPEIPSFARYPTWQFERGRLYFNLLPRRIASLVLDFVILLIQWPQANVIIDRRGRARLTEYGLATINSDPSFTLAATPGVVGTSRWLAPEIINPVRKGNSMPVMESKPADVFAFSMFAVEVFTGKRPFEGKNTVIDSRISRGDRPEMPGNAQEVGLTTEVWKLLESCWQQYPKKRPTMEEVVRRWEKFVDHGDDNNVVTEYVQITLVIQTLPLAPFSTFHNRLRGPQPTAEPILGNSRRRAMSEAVQPRMRPDATRLRTRSEAVQYPPSSQAIRPRRRSQAVQPGTKLEVVHPETKPEVVHQGPKHEAGQPQTRAPAPRSSESVFPGGYQSQVLMYRCRSTES